MSTRWKTSFTDTQRAFIQPRGIVGKQTGAGGVNERGSDFNSQDNPQNNKDARRGDGSGKTRSNLKNKTSFQ